MKELTGKQLQRLEKKRKKMAALLEITKLNDKDREIKAFVAKRKKTTTDIAEENCRSSSNELIEGDSSCRKRPCSQRLQEPNDEDAKNNKDAKVMEEGDSLAHKKRRWVFWNSLYWDMEYEIARFWVIGRLNLEFRNST